MTAKIQTHPDGRRQIVAYDRRSTELTLENWRSLEALARRLGLRNLGGPRARKPSWRVLLRAIAEGTLEVRVREGNGKAG